MKMDFERGARNNKRRKSENTSNTKLPDQDIFKIRVLLENNVPQRKIAKMFGVTQGYISEISTGKKRYYI